MSVYDSFFIIQFIFVIGLLLFKFYNILTNMYYHKCLYDDRMSWLGFSLFLICWGVGLVIVNLDFNELLYLTLFQLESWSLILLVGFQVVEVFFTLRSVAVGAAGNGDSFKRD
jgi:hypothetical protein